MHSAAAARRYARALFSLARDAGRVDAVGVELDRLAAQFEEHPPLHAALFRPLHPASERRGVLRAVCERLECGVEVRNFLLFLVDQRRLIDFDAIRGEYARLADEAAGRMRAEVVAASALQDAQADRLRRALSQHTGRDVELDVRIDPSLIGGAIAKVGDLVFDGSLRTQLSQLRDTLTRGQ